MQSLIGVLTLFVSRWKMTLMTHIIKKKIHFDKFFLLKTSNLFNVWCQNQKMQYCKVHPHYLQHLKYFWLNVFSYNAVASLSLCSRN